MTVIDKTTELPQFVGDGPCGAVFDDGLRRYRYSLWRRWRDDCEPSEMVAFIGLNPSTADESQDDPTIRRCIGFAKSWGFGGLVMLNLFAFRDTDPRGMKLERHPVGPWNDETIRRVCQVCGRTVCCWGHHGQFRFRSSEVRLIVRQFGWHFGLTTNGEPKHPLYLKADSKLIRWAKGVA